MKVGSLMLDADAYGRLSIPGSAELVLPTGDVKLWYHEAIMSARDDEIYFNRPADLHVTVTPVTDRAPLKIEGSGWKGRGKIVATAPEGSGSGRVSRSAIYKRRSAEPGQTGMTTPGRSIDLHGTIHVTAPGTYEVVVTGTLRPDAIEPFLLLGR